MKTSLLVLVLTMLGSIAGGQSRDVPFQVIDRGANCGEKSAGTRVIRTERAFEEAMKGVLGEDRIERITRNFDWDADQIVIVAGGEYPTGGYSIDVKRIHALDAQRLEIEAKLRKPGRGQMVTQAFTTPFVLLKMRKQVAVVKLKLDSG